MGYKVKATHPIFAGDTSPCGVHSAVEARFEEPWPQRKVIVTVSTRGSGKLKMALKS